MFSPFYFYRDFSLGKLSVGAELVVTLKWKDSRLTYLNLRDNPWNNRASSVQLWVPKYRIKDNTGSMVDQIRHFSEILVLRESFPLPVDDNDSKQGKSSYYRNLQHDSMDIFHSRFVNIQSNGISINKKVF